MLSLDSRWLRCTVQHSGGSLWIQLSLTTKTAAPNPQIDLDRLEMATDQAIAACGGDARDAVKALIVANEFLEAEMKQLQAAVSNGYARGLLPRDRKDWYD
jgi:hypothetical protein